MKTAKKLSGIALAAAAATAFAMAPVTASAAEEAQVHCADVHKCKGNSDCKSATNSSCKGQNACAGHGFIKLTAEQCKKIGGKIEE